VILYNRKYKNIYNCLSHNIFTSLSLHHAGKNSLPRKALAALLNARARTSQTHGKSAFLKCFRQLRVIKLGGKWPESPRLDDETLPLGLTVMTVTDPCATLKRSHADGGSCSARMKKYLMTFPWHTNNVTVVLSSPGSARCTHRSKPFEIRAPSFSKLSLEGFHSL
jgi:hypothetical protein